MREAASASACRRKPRDDRAVFGCATSRTIGESGAGRPVGDADTYDGITDNFNASRHDRQYIGDAVMAFGRPLANEQHASEAVRAALARTPRCLSCSGFTARGWPDLSIGAGSTAAR